MEIGQDAFAKLVRFIHDFSIEYTAKNLEKFVMFVLLN